MKRILITGGAGMIGSNLVKRIVKTGGSRVSIADNLWRGKKEYLLDNDGVSYIDFEKDFFNIDLTVPGAIDSLLTRVDYIIHLADIVAGIKYVFLNQGSVFRQNILINSNVINAARQIDLKGFIYVGTACSFPAHLQMSVNAEPLREIDQYPANPESAYGWSKLMGEYETFLMGEETNIPVSVITLHNVYGSPCDFDDQRGQVIPSLIRKAVRFPKEEFIVWGSGSQGRAFVHVEDVVDALVAAINKGFGNGLIQVGPDVCTTIREVAEIIVKVSGKDIEVEYDTSKPEGDRGRCADFSKAKKILGWEPRISLTEGLTQLYSWIEERIK